MSILSQNKQKQVWQEEHASKKEHFLPRHASSEVNEDVEYFYEFIEKHDNNLSQRMIIDIGAGKGRNTLFFLGKDFKVIAVDFIQDALNEVSKRATELNLDKELKIVNMEIDKHWLFPDNYFDYAIDSLSSIDIEGYENRCIYRNELYRTLKPGSLLLFRTVSVNDEFEKQLMLEHPGKEKHSSIWPISQKYQKNYSYSEIRDFYKDFEILELTEYTKKAIKMNREINATNFRAILRKPKK